MKLLFCKQRPWVVLKNNFQCEIVIGRVGNVNTYAEKWEKQRKISSNGNVLCDECMWHTCHFYNFLDLIVSVALEVCCPMPVHNTEIESAFSSNIIFHIFNHMKISNSTPVNSNLSFNFYFRSVYEWISAWLWPVADKTRPKLNKIEMDKICMKLFLEINSTVCNM